MSNEDDDYLEDDELYETVSEVVAKLLNDENNDQLLVASYLFANALKIYRTHLDDDDYYAILEEIWDRLFEDDMQNRTLH